MSGNYMDPPGHRLAYDRDGTVAVAFNDGAQNVQYETAAALAAWNSEAGGQAGLTGLNTIALIFPQPIDLGGVFWIGGNFGDAADVVPWETSPDTTNGIDGTWTGIWTGWPDRAPLVKPYYRMAAWVRQPTQNQTTLGIKGLRRRGGTGQAWRALHLYGRYRPDAVADRLAFWDPVLDQQIDPVTLDFGDTPRSSSADVQFRIKNLAAAKTAHATRVYLETLTDTTPSVAQQFTLSYDGGAFLAALDLPDLAAGAITPVITLRRATPANAVLSVWSSRVVADVGSWL